MGKITPTNTHQFLDPSCSHPYDWKKEIPYIQALRLNRICSDNKSFDKRCNDLKGWLMDRGFNDKEANIKSPRTFQKRSP